MDKATLNWLKIAERDLKAAKIHNLKRLAVECCKIKLEKHREEVLVKLDKSFIDSRYPEILMKLRRLMILDTAWSY